MPNRPFKPCNYPGCSALVSGEKYCEKHKPIVQSQQDERRGSAHERGYDSRWRRYSKWFLRQPDNVLCKLQLPGCTVLAKCVDHIDPPNGSNDPRFWDRKNHQAACIHCNSVKGHKHIKGQG